MTLVPTNKTKDILKKYEELWDNIKDLTKSKANNLGDYDKKYMKIKFNSDGNLLVKETLEVHIMNTNMTHKRS